MRKLDLIATLLGKLDFRQTKVNLTLGGVP